MIFQTLTVIFGLVLLLGDLRCASGDSQCGEGAVIFNDECYLIIQGTCSAGSLFIRDKCCRENCVRTCTAENCWHCCEAETLPPAQTAVTSCNQNCCQNSTKCASICCPGTVCEGSSQNCGSAQCCCQSRNCDSCCNCVTDSSCCQNCSRNSPCNQVGGCQQTNCATRPPCQQTNCGTGTSSTQVGGCQQTNCATRPPCQQTNCGTGTSSTQVGGCQQTNCATRPPCQQSNCGTGTSSSQVGCQQTNCGGSSSNQGGCQQTNSGCICCNGNWPILPVEPPATISPTHPPATISPTYPPAMTNPPETTSPPPAALECPPGTIPIGRSCRPIYCPKGTIMRNNDCIVLVCPAGTVWNGLKCAVPEPIAHNITFYNTVVTQSNKTKPGINLNNLNNFTINVPVVVNDSDTNSDGGCDTCSDKGCAADKDCTEKPTEPLEGPTVTNSTKCCTVMTPRTCESRNNRWYCYSRRYQRCGDFCTAPVIYLRPPRVYTRPQYVVVPPLSLDCNSRSNCGHPAGGFDCSGCGIGLMENCSNYCYRYSCPPHSCSFYDQQTYCINYPGSYGCMEDDGCFDDDWCS